MKHKFKTLILIPTIVTTLGGVVACVKDRKDKADNTKQVPNSNNHDAIDSNHKVNTNDKTDGNNTINTDTNIDTTATSENENSAVSESTQNNDNAPANGTPVNEQNSNPKTNEDASQAQPDDEINSTDEENSNPKTNEDTAHPKPNDENSSTDETNSGANNDQNPNDEPEQPNNVPSEPNNDQVNQNNSDTTRDEKTIDVLSYETSAKFNDYQFNFETNLDVYTHKNSKDIYVNFSQIIRQLSFIFDDNEIKNIEKNNNTIALLIRNENRLNINELDDSVELDSVDALNLTPALLGSSTSHHLKHSRKIRHNFGPQQLSKISFHKYGMDIIVDNGQIFMPLSLFNLLFMSSHYYNLYYNGKRFIGAKTQFVSSSNREMQRFYNENLNHRPSAAERVNNYNFMSLLFDIFYGLADKVYRENNVNNFDELAIKTDLKDELLSTDPLANKNAYQKLWYQYLDDRHSWILTRSYFDDDYFTNSDGKQLSTKRIEYAQAHQAVTNARRANQINNRGYSIKGDTAYIVLDIFDDARTNDTVATRANNDSYWYLFETLRAIKNQDHNHNIKKIVLDLATNNGGSTTAMQKVAAFFAKRELKLLKRDLLANNVDESDFVVDINNDGLYNSQDYLSDYQWYVLSSNASFSAANFVALVAKNSPNVKLIGRNSGGGMYSIFPTILPDGTNVNISGTIGWTNVIGSFNTLDQIPNSENGVSVDHVLSYDDFYSPNALDNLNN
ncbi:S41 family peptidase [Mycoplasma sp. CSL7475-4]|uniref:S41 family peptidase n=1 Tax=Mycoplasma sp. CSL7475-4 TaxID=2973942 RepID=UPI00216B100E|nr:S41 family peptidase [Mycoplasma sp. CSL7475-4]MCS4537153.1 S41 family peptidase [Mycoplasma sp. CSL7475-4]